MLNKTRRRNAAGNIVFILLSELKEMKMFFACTQEYFKNIIAISRMTNDTYLQYKTNIIVQQAEAELGQAQFQLT